MGLSRSRILDAAQVAAARGWDRFSLRAVAAQLQVSPMALYRHFASKDELVDALLDRVLGGIRTSPATDDWVADLGTLARAHREVLEGHPWAITALFTHSAPGPNATAIGEKVLQILDRGGITGEQAVATFSAIVALNYGWAAFSSARSDIALPAQSLGEALAALPRDEFPLTIGVAEHLAAYGAQTHYDLALEQLLTGIRSSAPRAASDDASE